MKEALVGAASLCRGEINGYEGLALQLGGYDREVMEKVGSLLQGKGSALVDAREQEVGRGEKEAWRASELFKKFDVDGSGSISLGEFCELTKHMGLFLEKKEVKKLFKKADSSGNGEIEFNEFEKALQLIRKEVADMAINTLGVSFSVLLQALVVSVLFLLLLFVFIFIGISVFGSPTTFSSVINSALPALAGVAVSSKRDDESAVMVELGSPFHARENDREDHASPLPMTLLLNLLVFLKLLPPLKKAINALGFFTCAQST